MQYQLKELRIQERILLQDVDLLIKGQAKVVITGRNGCGKSLLLKRLYEEMCIRDSCKTPVTTFIICALIPLVPGGGMYRMMLQAIQGHVDEALNIGLDTISIAGVLVLGILMVSTIMRSVFKTKRQVKRSEN